MAYTQEQYDNLKAARASGAMSVYYGNKRVDFRSLNEMDKILAAMEIELGIKKAARKMRGTVYSKNIQ